MHRRTCLVFLAAVASLALLAMTLPQATALPALRLCRSDMDCPRTHWCRPVNTAINPPMLCVPFHDAGDTCGGNVARNVEERCRSGLKCVDAVTYPFVSPGRCRKPCGWPFGTQACNAQTEFCGSEGVCRDFGSCGTDADCGNAANAFVRPTCQGAARCVERTCAWECQSSDASSDSGASNSGASTASPNSP